MYVHKSINLPVSAITEPTAGFASVGVSTNNVGYVLDDGGNTSVFVPKYHQAIPKHVWHDTHFASFATLYDMCQTSLYGSGTVAIDTTNLQYDGAWWLKSSATAGSGATVYFGCPIRIQDGFRLSAYLYSNPLSGVVTNTVGFCDTLDTTATPASGMYFRHAAGEVWAYCRNASGESSAKVCNAADAFTGLFEIILNQSRDSVEFKLTNDSGTVLGHPEITTNIPTVNEPAYVMASSRKSTTGATSNLLIDYLGFGHQYGWERKFTS